MDGIQNGVVDKVYGCHGEGSESRTNSIDCLNIWKRGGCLVDFKTEVLEARKLGEMLKAGISDFLIVADLETFEIGQVIPRSSIWSSRK